MNCQLSAAKIGYKIAVYYSFMANNILNSQAPELKQTG